MLLGNFGRRRGLLLPGCCVFRDNAFEQLWRQGGESRSGTFGFRDCVLEDFVGDGGAYLAWPRDVRAKSNEPFGKHAARQSVQVFGFFSLVWRSVMRNCSQHALSVPPSSVCRLV